MNSLKFFKEHIASETENSKEYAKMALELHDAHPRIARALKEMSEMELKNAEKLQTLMSEYHAQTAKNGNQHYTSDDYDGVYSDALKDLTSKSGEIKTMHDVYRKGNNY